jgi:hypothetical protein
MYKLLGSIFLAAAAVVFSPAVRAQQATGTPVVAETLQSMLAVTIRAKGFTCDKPLGAVRDTKRSPARSRRLGPQVQQRDVPDQPLSRHGGEGRTAPMTDRNVLIFGFNFSA